MIKIVFGLFIPILFLLTGCLSFGQDRIHRQCVARDFYQSKHNLSILKCEEIFYDISSKTTIAIYRILKKDHSFEYLVSTGSVVTVVSDTEMWAFFEKRKEGQ